MRIWDIAWMGRKLPLLPYVCYLPNFCEYSYMSKDLKQDDSEEE